MPWRKTLFVLHRDVGFVALGLTIVYGISGIAVNHRRDWNYDRSVSVENLHLGRAADLVGNVPADRRDAITRDPTAWAPDEEQRIVRAIAAKVGRPEGPRNAFWRSPDRLSLFFGPGDDDTVDYTPSTGEAIHTTRKDRILLRQMNFLHLNEPGRWWTWVADLYALSLLFLGISGVVMVKGRAGLRGRGGILVAVGIALPVLGWLVARR